MSKGKRTDWVDCPVCGDCDMRQISETDAGGETHVLIECVNHACASNGGDNASVLIQRLPRPCPMCEGRGGFDTAQDSQQCAWCVGTGKLNPEKLREESKRLIAHAFQVDRAIIDLQLKNAEIERLKAERIFPDIGPDPLKLNGEERSAVGSIPATIERLGKGVAVQQTGVPDQTMLAWRIDVDRIRDECIWRRASHLGAWRQVDIHKRQVDQRDATIDKMRKAITAHINGLPLHRYLEQQFPATVGHIPLRDWLDNLIESMAGAEPQPTTREMDLLHELCYIKIAVDRIAQDLHRTHMESATLDTDMRIIFAAAYDLRKLLLLAPDVVNADTLALDFIQQGHCVLCLKAQDGTIEFEIDGHQDAPRDPDVRKALLLAMAEETTQLERERAEHAK